MGNNIPTYISLYAGCGGLSLGLYNAGFKGLFAVEKSHDAFSTLKHNLIDKKKHFNWPGWLEKKPYNIYDIIKKNKSELISLQGTVDLVAGGPPCQGFSIAGKRNEKDERNNLIYAYIDFIKLVKPKTIFFENVKGFTISFKKEKYKSKPHSEIILEELKKTGYDVKGEIIDFSEYGVPQSRKRFIIVGCLKGKASDFFELIKTNKANYFKSKKINQSNTLEDAISDLLKGNGTQPSPDTKGFEAGIYSIPKSKLQEYLRNDYNRAGEIADSHRFVNHSKNIAERFKIALDNNLEPSAYKKYFKLNKSSTKLLKGNEYCPTLTTLPDDYIHYCEPRIFTVREYARIQTFPDWFEFKGKYTTGGDSRIHEVPRYTQIGNAIPPLFGEQSGIVLNKIIRECLKV